MLLRSFLFCDDFRTLTHFSSGIFLGLVVHNIYAQCYVECSLHTIQSVHHKFTHYTFFIHPVHTYMHKSYIIEIKKKHLTIILLTLTDSNILVDSY
jgi:hypothetical protein